jgi:DNA end-binding protein Ku
LIKSLVAPFKPEKYRDTYQDGLQKLIEAKSQGKTIAIVPHVAKAPVIDLMSALKKSLSQSASGQGPQTLIHAVPKREEGRKKRRKAS